MKSAVRTLSIIWGILCSIVTLVLVIVASLCVTTKDEAVAKLVEGGMSEAEAIASADSLIVTLFVFSFVALCATIYSFILATLVYKEKFSRVQRNILGAVAIVLLSLVPGVLFIIDANMKQTPAEEVAEKPKE
ncbi:MAG: hypothetical protein K6E59_02715 [Bacilli bacterium]|nr:hypothetical protein [Bacilli bacterium]